MKSNVWSILKKEIKEMFRDKKSLSMMLILPIMIPLLVIGMSAFFDSQMNKPIEDYNKIGFAYEMSDVEKDIAHEVGIDTVFGSEKELKRKYLKEKIDLYVTKENNRYIIHGSESDNTTYATALADSYFSSYKEYLQNISLTNYHVSPKEIVNIITVEKDIVESENFFADYITNYAFLFIIMAITVSSTYPATDATAGEKERGTLETLLTFPIKSRDIIVGKFLGVSLSSIITGVISLTLTIVSLLAANHMFKIYEDVNLMLSPESMIFAFLVIIAYSLLISGLCIAIASNSKTFKEAQSALTPLTFLSFFPSFVAFMIDLKTTTLLSFVPFLNFTLLFTDITSHDVNFIHVICMLFSTILVIIVVLSIIIKQYKSENVLFNK